MSYRVAGIDVHKRMLAVVITDVEVDGADQFTRRKVGTSPRELREHMLPGEGNADDRNRKEAGKEHMPMDLGTPPIDWDGASQCTRTPTSGCPLCSSGGRAISFRNSRSIACLSPADLASLFVPLVSRAPCEMHRPRVSWRAKKGSFRLARHYFDLKQIRERADYLFDYEAELIQSLPRRAAVH